MSTPIQTRADFQQLADVRLVEAKALLDLGHWDGAYYLTGYAVELALKACVIKRLMTTDEFPDKDFSKNCYTHDPAQLVAVAKLDADLKAKRGASAAFETYWQAVRGWSEHKRYHRIAEAEARQLYEAVSEPTNGVLSWVKTQW